MQDEKLPHSSTTEKPTSAISNEDRQSLRGEVMRVTYRSADSGYAVLQFKPEDQALPITVVGYCLAYSAGAHLILHGTFTAHPKYGQQFNARTADEIEPSTTAGLIRYLGSGLIEGLGEKTAKKIVDFFGKDTIEIIKTQSERLTEIRGISARKAQQIAQVFTTRGQTQAAERFFSEHEISPNLARRIIEKFGDEAITIVKQDPYRLAFELQGVGFITADNIALKLGFKLDSVERLRGGLYYALQKALDDGHCFQIQQELIRSASKLLEINKAAEFAQQLGQLIASGYLVRDEDRIYIRQLFQAEQFVAEFVAKRSKTFNSPMVSNALIESSLKKAAEELGLKFSAEQRKAVYDAVNYPLLIVTGGPGCGKTTIIRALARTFSNANKVLALAAPTGKAAQRMTQITDLPAATIHRLLKFDPRIGRFMHTAENPIRLAEDDLKDEGELVDAVIIDEASMLDLLLARDLFAAIPKNATLILVGDKDQLPSVGPGRVFHDLVSIVDLQIVSLSQLFRRSEQSQITTIAHSINAGIQPQIPIPDGQVKTDAYFIERDDTEDCARLIETLFSEQIPNKFGIKLDDITILTPANRGPLGTVEINRRIQEKINPLKTSEQYVTFKDNSFRLGDRVCQRVNNYKIDLFGVFNGDLGSVYQVNAADQSMSVELWDGRIVDYNSKEIGQLSLAYAMTVHRSQGSELPCVILVLHGSHYTLLQRQLLYTAVTRAKKLLIVVGSKRALQIAVKSSSARTRLTRLKENICKQLLE